MSAVIMRVSWNSNYDVLLRACLWCAVLLAVLLVCVTVVAPVVVGCCSAFVAALPKIAITATVFAGAWAVKP